MWIKSSLKIFIPVALATTLIMAGCSGGGTVPSTNAITPLTEITNTNQGVSSTDAARHRPAWITPDLSGEQVTILLSGILNSKMAHFWVNMPSGKEGFMAYRLDGVLYVRANICPPCRSYNFSLEKGILVCDTCGTRFNAKTGQGISGACVNYPKSEVTAELQDGKLTMTRANLAAAYAETLKMG